MVDAEIMLPCEVRTSQTSHKVGLKFIQVWAKVCTNFFWSSPKLCTKLSSKVCFEWKHFSMPTVQSYVQIYTKRWIKLARQWQHMLLELQTQETVCIHTECALNCILNTWYIYTRTAQHHVWHASKGVSRLRHNYLQLFKLHFIQKFWTLSQQINTPCIVEINAMFQSVLFLTLFTAFITHPIHVRECFLQRATLQHVLKGETPHLRHIYMGYATLG